MDNNITNIDQVKISLNPDGDNKFYALMLNGETFNETVGTNAFFNNVDVRWTNNSIENLTLVTHWKQFNEVETLPNFALTPAEDFSNPAGVPWTNQDTGQHTEDVGASALWRPFGRGFGLGGLAITGSYDYQILHRDDAVYSTPATLPTVGPPPYAWYRRVLDRPDVYHHQHLRDPADGPLVADLRHLLQVPAGAGRSAADRRET